MDVESIIAKFEESPERFPRKAIIEAIRQRDEIIPALLAMIEDPARLFQKCEEKPDYIERIKKQRIKT